MTYEEWFTKNWRNAGGLITQSQAAKILNRTTGRIRQMITEKKLTPYTYGDNAALIAFTEVMKYLDQQTDKIVKKVLDIPENASLEDSDEVLKEKIRIHRQQKNK